MREDLVGYLLGALDQDATNRIEQQLIDDPAMRRDLDRIGASLRPLDEEAADADPPPGLAEHTVQRVLAQRRPDQWVPAQSSWRLTDLAVAASILFAISMIILPSLHESRQQAALIECKNNLRAIGVALENYSDRNGGYFPYYATQGPFGIAGIYAPMLIESQLVMDRSVFICPSSGDKVTGIHSLSELRAAEADIAHLRDMLRSTGGSYGSLLGFMDRDVYRAPRRDRLGGLSLMVDRPNRPGEGDVAHSNSPNHGGRGQNTLCRDGSVMFLEHPRECPSCDDFFISHGNRVEPGWNESDQVFGPSEAKLSDSGEQF